MITTQTSRKGQAQTSAFEFFRAYKGQAAPTEYCPCPLENTGACVTTQLEIICVLAHARLCLNLHCRRVFYEHDAFRNSTASDRSRKFINPSFGGGGTPGSSQSSRQVVF
jgi:hypothetical protein